MTDNETVFKNVAEVMDALCQALQERFETCLDELTNVFVVSIEKLLSFLTKVMAEGPVHELHAAIMNTSSFDEDRWEQVLGHNKSDDAELFHTTYKAWRKVGGTLMFVGDKL